MTRIVTVNYLMPIWVDVDLDAGTVTRVREADESILLIDNPALEDMIKEAVISASFTEWPDHADVDPATLTAEERDRVIEIAENTEWPAWQS